MLIDGLERHKRAIHAGPVRAAANGRAPV